MGGGNHIGGLVGVNNGTISNAYWDSTTTGQSSAVGTDNGTSSNVNAVTSSTATNPSSYTHLGTWTEAVAGSGVWVARDGSNNKLWVMVEGSTRPFLYSEYSTSIRNAHQLQLMAYDLGASYTLNANVDASETSGSNASGMWTTSGFSPVGNSTVAFSGSLDGENHTIADLSISRSGTDFVGLFGNISSGGNIGNLGLVGGSVVGRTYVGELAGTTYGSISNAYATGSVSATGDDYAGGLVGTNSGTINDSYATGNVSGSNSVGGLVGFNGYSINNSHASGSVAGVDRIGGLVGYNIGTIGSNTYASSNVAGNSYVGGLVGHNAGAGAISDAHATGTVSAGSSKAGGLVGWNGSSGTISNAYATGDAGAPDMAGGLVGYNTGSISDAHASGNVAGNGHQGGLVGTNAGSISNAFASGSVFGSVYYAGGLVGQNSGNIDNAYATGNASGGSAGDYIGGLVGGNDSGGRISNAYATGSVVGNSNTGGLVGQNVGTVSTAHATGNVSGSGLVGGLVGENTGSISNAYASGSVTGSGDYIGGLVGGNESDASISNAHASGNVSGAGHVGGLVGQNVGTVSSVYASGSVTGTGFEIGGLAGQNNGTISNAYASGNVAGSNLDVGGLVGYNNGGTISNAYASGNVAGTGNIVGGLVGWNSSNGTISNAYATGNVSGSGLVGGLVGENDSGGSIRNAYASGSVSGSDSIGALVGYNEGTVTASFWLNSVSTTGIRFQDGSIDSLTRGLSASEARSASTYSTAGWDVATVGGSSSVWRSYDGSSMPLLRSFLTALTVTTDNTSKTYDGTTSLSGSYTLSDSGADTRLILGSANYSSSTSQNVGRYTVGTSGLYSGQQGYDIRYVNGTATITRASLTVTANDASKTTDGTAYSGGNGVRYSGFVGGESTSVLGGGLVYGGTAQGAAATGSYSLSASGLSAGNYVLTYVDGTLVVNAATVPTATTDNTPLTQVQKSLQATQPGTSPDASALTSVTSFALDVQSCGIRLPNGMVCH